MNINPKKKKWSSQSLVVVYTVFINILNELLFKFTGFIFIHFSLSLSFYYVLFVISVSLLYFFSWFFISVLDLLLFGLVSQTGLRLSQDKVIIQLGHQSNFYKRVFIKHYWCPSQTKALIYFKINQSKVFFFSWNSSDLHFSLGLGLNMEV